MLPLGRLDAGPPRKSTGGIGGGGAIPLSMEGAATLNTIWVDKTTSVYVADGSVQYPYNTIQAGLNAAALLLPTISKPVEVIVMPGVYAEQVTLSVPYVYLTGWDRDTTIITAAAVPTLDVTTQYTAVRDLTVITTADALNTYFVRVRTVGPAFTVAVEFWHCYFFRNILKQLSVDVETNARANFHFCRFYHTPRNIGANMVRATGAAAILGMYDCVVVGMFHCQNGATLVVMRSDVEMVYHTAAPGNIYLFDCIVRDDTVFPPVFLGLAPAVLVIKGCRFSNSGTWSPYDICSDVAVTGAVIENNVMGLGTRPGGIDPDVSHVNPIKYVGAAGNKDFYVSTQDALTACTYDDCVIKLLKDEALGAALLPPARPCTIDGNGKHLITRAGNDVLSMVTGARTVLRDLEIVGIIQFGGADAITLRLEDCSMTGRVMINGTAAGGTFSVLRSSIIATAAYTFAMMLESNTPNIILDCARMKGFAAAAIFWDGAINNSNVASKHSTILHGSLAANDPFGRAGVQVPNFRSHHTAYNSIPGSGWATNLIAAAQEFNTVDPAVDF